MEFFYTARGAFTDKDGDSWVKYIDFSKLNHLTEVISLDSMLNELLVEPKYDSEEEWNHVVTDGEYFTGLFDNLNYVLSKIDNRSRFNLLMVVKEPDVSCEKLLIDNFEFIGYDLLDKSYDVSALVNCSGFDNVFAALDLNHFGLISEFEKARDINKLLLEKNLEEYHADCNRFAIWRHKSLGREQIS